MKPGPFVHHAPTTVDEAVAVLGEVGHDGKVLAGGQSLIPVLSMRLANPGHLVDINGVAQEVRQQAAGGGGCRARHPVDAQADVQQLLGGCVGRLLAHATDSWAVVGAGSAAGVGWVAVDRARRVSSAASIRR